ncbi:uncharacterized protein LOC132894918 isoform X1 [Neoarius graeffei]|uniref:uncharacterized protein LOC132894918 isoform X1 n=1 Tax=Neoarius graeffei TaxID=443677 RepID=UPI00298CA566|nr:uncharacterized protein LOC132894918 isoform X1 [Neoarius graeffei]XP_060791036.1 uncharacterized protein LOC132894918 isoform X1 [Neoarius graeffei]XP_060791037.1 uncharacterized protein LOC132894918 isoform X1 [Neoarius graeffei]
MYADPSPPPPTHGSLQTPPPTHRSIQTPAPPAPTHGSSTPRRDIRDSMFVCILTLLEEVKDAQRNHGRILQALLQDRHNIANPVCSTLEGFPLKMVNEVDCMEEKLANPTFMSELIAAVVDIGGGTVDGATRRMMAFLIDHNLSRQCNFVGRNGKRGFKPLKLFEVIYGALKKNAMTSQITRKDAEKAVSKWLIGSRDRGGNRQARQAREAAPQEI